MKKAYIPPMTEVIGIGLKGTILDMEGTHSVEKYREKDWANVGEEGEDDDIIYSNQTSLWD